MMSSTTYLKIDATNQSHYIYQRKSLMKMQIVYLVIMGLLGSCSSDDSSNNSELILTGNWKLIEMTGSVPNSETSGADMEWQETYRFESDGSFQKSRTREGETIEASGTYRWSDASEEPLLELDFNSDSEIIGSCNQNNLETMSFQSETIFVSSWMACDGPGLTYKKVD